MAGKAIYYFGRSEQSLFCEIYFPKKVAHQGAIFGALEDGYNAEIVKKYLHEHVALLLEEFKIYPALLDPKDYTKILRVKNPVSEGQAKERIDMYEFPFKGWSIYTVDGVWFNEDKKSEDYGKPVEETTQIVRVMFRFQSSFEVIAEEADCEDVLRNILFTTIAKQGRLYDYKIWGQEEKRWFLKDHPPWPKGKRDFINQYYAPITKEINKWIDDRTLFVFGYLVRKFAENVLIRDLYEKEIWVTSLFAQNLNVIQRIDIPQPKGENHVAS
ncbi:MAG: hypothetical protein Q7S77_03000 [Candidatus Staskawiczbacteria bacterium]|nr:hypothetical protein [Candidatus Staskawiczbacteria bacterium]